MLSARKTLLLTSFFYVIFLLFPLRVMPQSQTSSGLLPISGSFPRTFESCRDAELVESELDRDEPARYSPSDRSNAYRNCDEFLPDGSLKFSSSDVPRPSAPRASESSKLEHGPRIATVASPEELKDIGEQGTTIARVRLAVLDILESENACSAWFRRADPQVPDTFRSLKFEVDENGPDYVIKELNDRGNWMAHGPYIARTRQNTGPGTTITLNANGAFFRAKDEIYKINWTGAEARETGAWRRLEVGPYDGGTLQAQVITVLHELGHVVDAIPWDDSSQIGYDRSQANTELIVHYCKAEASASPKRLKRAMAQSLAN
jgi:hypothetical protein